MTLIRQVIRDLVKDAGWVVFYGFLTAMSIMAFVLVGLSYQHVASQNDAIRRFTQNDVSMVRVKDLSGLMTAADRETTAQPISTGSGRQQGLVDLFQKHDNLGSLVLLPGTGGYQHRLCGRLHPADSIPVSGRQRCTHRRGFAGLRRGRGKYAPHRRSRMHSDRCSIRYGRLPSAALHSTRIGESEENALCFLAIL